MQKILTFLKNNWILALVIVYIISPVDLLPINPADDVSLLIAEMARRYIVGRLDKKKVEGND